jgi:hypothetical protein
MTEGMNDYEIINLAVIQFGEEADTLAGVGSLSSLVSALIHIARSVPTRAIAVRSFIDDHDLNRYDPNNEMGQLLEELRQRDVSYKASSGEPIDLHDWPQSRRTTIRSSRRPSIWKRILNFFHHR